MSTALEDFEIWWGDEGSALRPFPIEDVAEFAERIARIAWANGAYKALTKTPTATTESK